MPLAPLLGGFTIADVRWISSTGIRVRFETATTDRLHQLYAGRTLIGATATTRERQIVGALQPSHWPQELQIVSVDPADQQTDLGAYLPERPYNRVKMQCETSGWPADSKFLEVAAGTEPGGAVDADNVLQKVIYDTDRVYVYVSPPMPGSGEWNFEIAGRDDCKPAGNLGDPLPLSQEVLAHPPDVVLDSDGRRLAVAVAAGVATVTFAYNWEVAA